jgi:hypothetical protein
VLLNHLNSLQEFLLLLLFLFDEMLHHRDFVLHPSFLGRQNVHLPIQFPNLSLVPNLHPISFDLEVLLHFGLSLLGNLECLLKQAKIPLPDCFDKRSTLLAMYSDLSNDLFEAEGIDFLCVGELPVEIVIVLC